MEGNGEVHSTIDREVVYDFEKERELLMIISCYKISDSSKLKRFLSLLYVSFFWLFLFYEMCMGFYSIALTIAEETKMLETFHMAILTFYSITHLSNKHLCDLGGVMEIIKKGFYTYEEYIDEAHYKIRRDHVRKIRLVNKWFRRIIISSGINFLLFNTAKKYIENTHRKKTSGIPINPYLPIPFFAPFDTTSFLTFTIVYSSNVVIMYSICTVTICLNEIFISLIEQLKAQLEILNLSISNVEERALRRYLPARARPRPDVRRLYQRKEFQDCILKCLRENVRHHQVLLRFTRLIKNYIQMTFFLLVVLAALTLSLSVLVITKSKFSNEELLGVSTFFIMLLTELLFALQFCLYGQEISNESGRIFFTLWSTPWWCFDERVKSVLYIMMLNTKKPITLKTTYLNVSMLLESFTSIISNAYQVGNIMLNM